MHILYFFSLIISLCSNIFWLITTLVFAYADTKIDITFILTLLSTINWFSFFSMAFVFLYFQYTKFLTSKVYLYKRIKYFLTQKSKCREIKTVEKILLLSTKFERRNFNSSVISAYFFVLFYRCIVRWIIRVGYTDFIFSIRN